MSELEEFDETKTDEDEYETPNNVYEYLVLKYNIKPELDVCATNLNRKCAAFYNKENDGLKNEWVFDVWCNPPHSKTEAFVKKAYSEWNKHNINILMIVPANAIGAHYFDPIFAHGPEIQYYRYSGRIRFLQNGKPAPSSSRNGYFAVIMRKQIE